MNEPRAAYETIGPREICGLVDHHLADGICPSCVKRCVADAKAVARAVRTHSEPPYCARCAERDARALRELSDFHTYERLTEAVADLQRSSQAQPADGRLGIFLSDVHGAHPDTPQGGAS